MNNSCCLFECCRCMKTREFGTSFLQCQTTGLLTYSHQMYPLSTKICANVPTLWFLECYQYLNYLIIYFYLFNFCWWWFTYLLLDITCDMENQEVVTQVAHRHTWENADELLKYILNLPWIKQSSDYSRVINMTMLKFHAFHAYIFKYLIIKQTLA